MCMFVACRYVKMLGQLPDDDCYAVLQLWNPVKFNTKVTQKWLRHQLVAVLLRGSCIPN